MGMLSDFMARFSKGADPLEVLKERSNSHPEDARLAADVAQQLKARGDVVGAREYALRAAAAHKQAGFAQRALAVVKGAAEWGPPSTELLGELAALHLELKHKEDARSTLIQLRRLHQSLGNTAELPGIDAQLTELGPSR